MAAQRPNLKAIAPQLPNWEEDEDITLREAWGKHVKTM